MPRLRKTEALKQAEVEQEAFLTCYRVGKARLRLHELDIARILDISESTLALRKKSPDKFSIGEFKKMVKLFEWTPDDILEIVGMK